MTLGTNKYFPWGAMWLTHGIVSIPTLLLDGAFKNFIPLGMVTKKDNTPSINLLRKHGGKTGEELKAEGK